MVPCIILSGGRGKRMGNLTNEIPKPMIKIRNKPIIWHIIIGLYKKGFREFIFPLGYKGHKIEEYLVSLKLEGIKLVFKQTGIEQNIGNRLYQVRRYIQNDRFIIINGDCICDFDGMSLYNKNIELNSLVTLLTCKIISPYGLLSYNKNQITSFERDVEIDELSINNNGEKKSYYINSGIACIKASGLDYIDLEHTPNFEIDLFNKCIQLNKISFTKQNCFWTALETPKDVENLNNLSNQSEFNLEYLKYRKYLEK